MHSVSRFVFNDLEGRARIECVCGWERQADNVTELFEEYHDHRALMQLEDLLGGVDGS